MALRLLPTESIHILSRVPPSVLLDRLKSRTVSSSFLPWAAPAEAAFEGKIQDGGFQLRLAEHRADRLNPVIRGAVIEWQEGSAVSARVSLNWPFALQTIVSLGIYLVLGGAALPLGVQVLTFLAFVALLEMNRRGVAKVATRFRREMSSLAEIHDSFDPNSATPRVST